MLQPARLGAATILAWLWCAGCAHRQPPLHRYEYAQLLMGVQVRLTVYAPDQRQAADGCVAAFERIAQLEDIMSDYRPDSELMRLCAKAGGPPVQVSPELFIVLTRAQEVSQRSGGAFDVTVGPYVGLWRKARKTGQFPSSQDLARARDLVGCQLMRLDPEARSVQLLKPGMKLDLGGIAKGYAGDCAIAVLKSHGINSALFEAGGDIVASDPPPQKQGWTIALADSASSPSPGTPVGATPVSPKRARQASPLQEEGMGSAGSLPPRQILLANSALSTSGDSEQYVIVNGQRYSHIVDPRTGLGLTKRYQATILAPDGLTSDPLSTTSCILGPKEASLLVRSYSAIVYNAKCERP